MKTATLVLILFLAGCEKHEPIGKGPLLPSVTAIQQQLNQLEPENPIKVDGKLGPKTAEKWDRVFCEQSAKRAWDKFEER